MLAVQECYISVCKEKSELEERVHSLEELEASLRQTEVTHRKQVKGLNSQRLCDFSLGTRVAKRWKMFGKFPQSFP